MAEELRALHDRMGATTVYVTHDQLEAMQMGDKIVVMNHGVVEQFGTPQDIYDQPATLFVADFIGSPVDELPALRGHRRRRGRPTVTLGDTPIALPQLQEPAGGKLVLGVRPEHVALTDTAAYRGRIEATEYLGTTQIVTLSTPHGPVKARIPSARPPRVGETVGPAPSTPARSPCSTPPPAAPSALPPTPGSIMAEVTLSGLSKSFGATQALKDVSLTIPDGAFVVLLGPTGAGKTTTLRLIAGLDQPDAGDIRIGGAVRPAATPPRSATWRWCSSNTRSTRT